MPSQRYFVTNERGHQLAVIVEQPETQPKLFGMFSHCFTCTKDLKAIVKISRKLASHGMAIARFDFTGLGDSSGDFSETNFETNIADILSISGWLAETFEASQLLMGLSLGGAAMMAASQQIPSAAGIVTIAAPSDTRHLAEFLVKQSPEIESEGTGTVIIGGRRHTLKPQLIASLRNRDLQPDMAAIKAHHLILHSPQDETLSFRHAEQIFQLTGGIKSFVTLDGADHLLMNQPGDVDFVADQIALWSARWI